MLARLSSGQRSDFSLIKKNKMSDFFKPSADKIVVRLLPTAEENLYACSGVHRVKEAFVINVDLGTGQKFRQCAKASGLTITQLLERLVLNEINRQMPTLANAAERLAPPTINNSGIPPYVMGVNLSCLPSNCNLFPQGEPPGCTCDIKDLMVQGCKCGFLGSK